MIQQVQGILVEQNRQPITFKFGRKLVGALPGQSIGAALYDAGIRVFSRSYSDDRPRGLSCVSGDCGNCLMRVNGRDNVRVCVEPARQNQEVQTQYAWPSVNFDITHMLAYAFKGLRRPLERPFLANAAQFAVESHATSICVIGAGPAGLAAALEVANTGLDVLIIERLPRLGGHLLHDGDRLADLEPYIEGLQQRPNVKILTDATAFDLSRQREVSAWQDGVVHKIQAAQVIVCTGGRERPFIFHNNDLPGVFLSRGIQRLGRLYGVSAGRKAVILTDHPEGARLAEEMTSYGIETIAVIDPRPAQFGKHVGRGWHAKAEASVHEGGSTPTWRLMTSTVVLEALGNNHVQGVKVAQRNADGSIAARSTRDLECDLLCIASIPMPAKELLVQAGVRFGLKDGKLVPISNVSGILAAGGAAGTIDLNAQVLEGRLRGAEAASAQGRPVAGINRYLSEWNNFLAQPDYMIPAKNLMPFVDQQAILRYVCPCADTTQAEIELAMVEGARNFEEVKERSRVARGACEGRGCEASCIEICSRHGQQLFPELPSTANDPVQNR